MIRPFLFASFAVLALAACQVVDFSEPPRLPDKPIVLKVAGIELSKEYQAGKTGNSVANAMPIPPAAAVERWAQKRIAASGQGGVASILIKEADVVQTPVPSTSSTWLQEMFTNERAVRYDARVVVEISVSDEFGVMQGYIEATATRSDTLNEDADASERDELWNKMMEQIILSLDKEVEAALKENLKKFL